MARAMAALYVSIGALVFISMLAAYPSEADREAIAIAAGTSVVLGVALFLVAPRVPLWLIHAAIAGAALEICIFINFSGVSVGVYATMFIWVTLVASFFFPGRVSAGHVALMLGAYALTLINVDSVFFGPIARWLLTALTLGVAWGVTSWLVYGLRAGAIREEEMRADAEMLARTDALTGLPNRRWLRDELEREMARSRRQGFPIWAAVVDLDRFKLFNDRNGHLAGDELLHSAGDVWRSVLRVSDFLARTGGEEFVLLLPDCGAEEALEVVERMRAATPLSQTCSAGLAKWDGFEGPEDLIRRADVALYRAKNSGRDRTVVTDESDPDPEPEPAPAL